MRDVRPTVFLGVPRVWEKMQEKMVEIAKQNSGFKRKVAAWAKDIGLRGNLSKMNGYNILTLKNWCAEMQCIELKMLVDTHVLI